jgi:hypothetical protein
MRQRRWLELIKDYDLGVHYHPGKVNVVADALSRKNHCNCLTVKPMDHSLCHELERLNIEIVQHGRLTNVTVESTIKDQIISAQRKNSGIAYIMEKVRSSQQTDFSIDDTDVLWFKNRLVVPKVSEFCQLILNEAHKTRFTIYPVSNKMYQDLKHRFWWTKIKIEIASYVARCDTCRRVMVVRLKPVGMLQPLPIPSWKWDDIGMDFITGLPTTSKGFDSIWVIID